MRLMHISDYINDFFNFIIRKLIKHTHLYVPTIWIIADSISKQMPREELDVYLKMYEKTHASD